MSNGIGSESEVRQRLQSGLRILLSAWSYAHDVERSPWQFAVEIERLRAAGMDESDFRWLSCKGYVCHACEETERGEPERTFGPPQGLSFFPETSFVLTSSGVSFVTPVALEARSAGVRTAPVVTRPVWDQELRELHVEGVVVKRFRVPAVNQELILAAFEEEGWPPCVDDPLPPAPGIISKRRLHTTIQSLNRNQRVVRIRFSGNGQADGICWELLGK